MAQHDYDIANQSGANFRADLNNALDAIVSNNSGSSEPSTKFAYEWWVDTSNNLLKLRNSANNAWITLPLSITADNATSGGLTVNGNLATTGTVDINGQELILDADADTSITADTDDTIHFRINGDDDIIFTTGIIDVKNSGAKSQVRLYCESSNAHYVAIESPAHAVYSGNVTVTLPNKTSTLQGSASETITGAGGSNALDDDIEVSLLNTASGTASLTLSAGRFVGQRKIIIMTVAGNNATMTQSNGNLNSTNVSTSIVFNAVGESVVLVYNGSNWNVVSSNGATVS